MGQVKWMWSNYGDPLVKRWIYAPFSNKVTKFLIFVGAGIVATPLIEHLILKVIFEYLFEVQVPIDVPDTEAYFAGVSLMLGGALYNLGIQYLEKEEKKRFFEKEQNLKREQKPHDEKIITGLLSLLPYENTHFWIGRAPHSGLRRDFAHDLDQCEKFITSPYLIFNTEVEKQKQVLVKLIKEFNEKCMGYLGAQEDITGKMYMPPYHLKNMGGKYADGYYEKLHLLTDTAVELLKAYDEFIYVAKCQGFVISEI